MTQVALTARHPSAAICWTSNGRLFVEYSVKAGGPPYIVSFPCSETGLIRALNLLIENPAPILTPAAQVIANHPAVKRVKVNVSEDVRDEALAIVRRMLK